MRQYHSQVHIPAVEVLSTHLVIKLHKAVGNLETEIIPPSSEPLELPRPAEDLGDRPRYDARLLGDFERRCRRVGRIKGGSH